MRITRISFEGYRRFSTIKEIPISEEKNVTIILGNNNAGKTSILDAIAKMLSIYARTFPNVNVGEGASEFVETDIHQVSTRKRAKYLSVSADFKFANGESCTASKTKKGQSIKQIPASELKGLKEIADTAFDRIEQGDNVFLLPILAYYGTERGNITFSKRRRNFRKVFNRWDCYDKSLNPKVDFKSCFEHFDYWEDEERRAWKEKGTDYESPTLQTIRKVFELCIKGFVNPRTELNPLRFVMDELLPDGTSREMRIEQMSDGFKMMIAMVNDIASRMIDANPGAEDPLLTPGIVLIDEVDMHLHPAWQRNVLKTLTDCFPKVQFIVTTHSPVVALGGYQFAQMVTISEGDDIVTDKGDYIDYNVSQILQSGLFGLKSIYSPVWDEDIAKRDELLKKTDLSNDEDEEFHKLNEKLSHLSSNETITSFEDRKLNREILDFLKGLK